MKPLDCPTFAMVQIRQYNDILENTPSPLTSNRSIGICSGGRRNPNLVRITGSIFGLFAIGPII
jgi:hypothetical protein